LKSRAHVCEKGRCEERGGRKEGEGSERGRKVVKGGRKERRKVANKESGE
jgi:hypothetical protein